jgi:hypothetical protein
MSFTSNNASNSSGTAISGSTAEVRSQRHDNPAQKLIAENVKFLMELLKQGKSEALTAYLGAMARFHHYSFGNILQIARYQPTATHVAGMHAWNQLHRYVRRGEKGIPIFAPMMGRKRNEEEQETKSAPILFGFRRVYVWDIAQTEGEPLPELPTVHGKAQHLTETLSEFVRSQGIHLEFSDQIAPAHGVSYGGKIVLLPGLTEAETFATLVHETAHELLHKKERRTLTNQSIRETEAEAVAFVVSTSLGLDYGTAAADYIGLWNGNADLLAESLEVIQQTSALILTAVEPDEPALESSAAEINCAEVG